MTPLDRRKFPGIPATYAVSFRSVFLTDPNPSITRDVGGGGIRFFTAQALTPGMALKLDIQHPERPQPLRLTAEVLWSRPVPPLREPGALPFETAVVFTGIPDADRALLLRSPRGHGPGSKT